MFSILALGGGGLKGYLEVGAIEELEFQYGPLHLKFKDGFYGCSVGSIIATCLAFGLSVKTIREEFMNFGSLQDLFGTPDFNSISTMLSKKGVYDMEKLDTFLISKFNNNGIDLKNKKLRDALVPLRITASNLSKGIPTIFQGDVPVLSAIRASCCIPYIFYPQIINSSVYVDGGFITTVLLNLIPKEQRDKTLSVSIIHTRSKILPRNIHSMNPIDFSYRLYKTLCIYEHSMFTHKNNIELYYSEGSGISSFSEREKDEMIIIGKTLTREFLRTKCSS
jgi:NTE family protein